MSIKTFVHVRDHDKSNWASEGRDLDRLPRVEEYIALGPRGPRYRVIAVEHVLFEADYEAEIYAVKHEGVLPILPEHNP